MFAVASAVAQPAVRCESVDGRYTECGVTNVSDVSLMRQLSTSRCVEGTSWGFRDGVIWVDEGCRAEFALTASRTNTPGVPLGGTLVVCESASGKRTLCPLDPMTTVALRQQLSRNDCVRDRSWGVSDKGIWVDEGCRAEFIVGAGEVFDRGFPLEPLNATVVCESIDGRTARCAADTMAGVQLIRQMSDSSCRFGTDWGYDGNAIWVRNGCRAEFAVRSRTAAPISATMVAPEPDMTRRPTTITTTTTAPTPAPMLAPTTAPLAPARTATVVCESINDARARCRAETQYGVSLLHQRSDSACVLGRTWGFDQDGVWVSGGCRAEFLLGNRGTPAPMLSSAAPTFVCESIDRRRNHCPVDTSAGVRLLQQLSGSDCVLNRTWGIDRDGVWVAEGCRAEFSLGGEVIPRDPGSLGDVPRSARVVCESKDGQRTVCPADARMGVAVVRELDGSKCVLNSTWGFDSEGIWVTDGCRAEFVLRR